MWKANGKTTTLIFPGQPLSKSRYNVQDASGGDKTFRR
jgi:hypothetical protein